MKKINDAFLCINCQNIIGPAQKTCRNHCPRCFVSMHVDGDIPGDRASRCYGIMLPFEYQILHGTIKLHFICLACKKKHRNKIAADDQLGELDNLLVGYRPKFISLIDPAT